MVVEKKLLINDKFKFYTLKNINTTKGFLEYGEKKNFIVGAKKQIV